MKNAHFIVLAILLVSMRQTAYSQDYYLYSPDSKLTFKLFINEGIKYAVDVNGKNIMPPSVIGCKTDFLQNIPLKILTTQKSSVKNQTLFPGAKDRLN